MIATTHNEAKRAPVDARLTTQEGAAVRLASFRGKPSLVFYEDRDSAALNQHLKDKLFAEGKKRGLLSRVNLVPVAYLEPFDFFPARGFALSAVRDMSKKIGVDIFVDFNGALAASPLKLPTSNSTVVLLDHEGRVLYRRSGRHSEAEISSLLGMVERAVVPVVGSAQIDPT